MATIKNMIKELGEMGISMPQGFDKAGKPVIEEIYESAMAATADMSEEDAVAMEVRQITADEAAEDPENLTEGEWVLVADFSKDEATEDDDSDVTAEDDKEAEEDMKDDDTSADEAEESVTAEETMEDKIRNRPHGSFIALSSVKHNGNVYMRGDVIPSDEISNNDAATLVRAGIIAG